jgi:LPS sulfotransferase NodH
MKDNNPELLGQISPGRIVYLGRRDRAAHVASLARAAMSGIWNQKQESGRELKLEYSQASMELAENGIAAQEAAWARLFQTFGIAPLRLWYEDALADPQAAIDQVAGYLGIEIAPGARVEVPQVLKQSDAGSSDWAERYAQSQGLAPFHKI